MTYPTGAPSRNDVRIVICNQGTDVQPDKCTFCNLAFDCKAAYHVKSKEVARTIRLKKLSEGHDVMESNCECKENITEARTSPQLLINRKDVLFSGGLDESNNLRQQRRSHAAC